MDKPVLKTADEAMEYAARLIEDVSLLDFRGIASKRKRDREDAELRLQTAREVRAACASHIRAFINRPDLEPRAILQRVRDGENAAWLMQDVWPLAWRGLVRIEAHVVCNSNQVPPETYYTVALTERGERFLSEREEA